MNAPHVDAARLSYAGSERGGSGLAGWLLESWAHLKENGSRLGVRTDQRQMKVIETLSLGGRRQVVLIECAGEKLLIGVGPDSIQTITRVGSNANLALSERSTECQ